VKILVVSFLEVLGVVKSFGDGKMRDESFMVDELDGLKIKSRRWSYSPLSVSNRTCWAKSSEVKGEITTINK
jgi:hypothetical protein